MSLRWFDLRRGFPAEVRSVEPSQREHPPTKIMTLTQAHVEQVHCMLTTQALQSDTRRSDQHECVHYTQARSLNVVLVAVVLVTVALGIKVGRCGMCSSHRMRTHRISTLPPHSYLPKLICLPPLPSSCHSSPAKVPELNSQLADSPHPY